MTWILAIVWGVIFLWALLVIKYELQAKKETDALCAQVDRLLNLREQEKEKRRRKVMRKRVARRRMKRQYGSV